MQNHIRDQLSGVFAPIVTPFVKEKVSYARLKENIIRYNLTDLRGYMPLGSNGEYLSLNEHESLKVLDVIRKHKASDKTTVAGCGRESAKATVEFIKKAADRGIDLAFVLTPHYFVNLMTEDALYRYFTDIADKSPIPVVVYNAPKFASGLLISPELLKRLLEHPNIAAMKNSSHVENSVYREVIPADAGFYLIAGNIKTFYPGLKDGAVGGVLSTASYLPEFCCKLYALHAGKKYEEAERLHARLNYISEQTIGRFGPPGVKYAMDLRGFFGGDPRVPLLPLAADDKKMVAGFFMQHGIGKFQQESLF